MLEQAFYQACHNAEPAEAIYVSLYCRGRCYGGPEEGGWWYDVVDLEASQLCDTREQAEAILKKIQETVIEQANSDARARHGNMCRDQLDAVNWDGELAQHMFGEVDGPDSYFVVLEEVKGSQINNRRPQWS